MSKNIKTIVAALVIVVVGYGLYILSARAPNSDELALTTEEGALQTAPRSEGEDEENTDGDGVSPQGVFIAPQTGVTAPPIVSVPNSITQSPDPRAPKIAIKNPGSGVTVNGVLNIETEIFKASDDSSIDRVEYYINNKLVGVDTYIPYGVSYDTELGINGLTTITVKAYSSDGFVGYRTISVIVINPPKFSEFFAEPLSIREGEAVTVTWKVDFSNSCIASDTWGGTKPAFGSETFVLYKASTFKLTCAGVVASAEKSISVDVVAIAPTLSITNPASNSIVKDLVTISADAVDNSGISKVLFYLNSELIGTDGFAPYAYNLNTNQLRDNKYIIKVVAYDLGGNTAEKTVAITTGNGNY